MLCLRSEAFGSDRDAAESVFDIKADADDGVLCQQHQYECLENDEKPR